MVGVRVYWIWQWVSCHWFALGSRRRSIYCSSAGRGTTSPGTLPGSWRKPKLLVESSACSAPGNKIHYSKVNIKHVDNGSGSCAITFRWFDLSRFLRNWDVELMYTWLFDCNVSCLKVNSECCFWDVLFLVSKRGDGICCNVQVSFQEWYWVSTTWHFLA